MTIYIVQYHDNSWGAQESPDTILGVYDSEDAAYKRADEFESKYAWEDDTVSVLSYELNEDVKTLKEEYDSE